MVYVIVIIFLSWFALVIALVIGWRRLFKKTPPRKPDQHTFISVIVPVRNEAEQVGWLLSDLMAQQYPAFEVIIIDDHSEDDTFSQVQQKIWKDDRFRVRKNINAGKKQALTQGIREAEGEIVVTTDADCRVGPQWLSGINAAMREGHVKMAMGGVRIRQDNSFFSYLQAIEFASLIGSGAATLAWGVPSMCNGANLAFRRAVFFEVNGYEGNFEVASGDDEFLMRRIVEKYPQGIRFLTDTGTIVSSAPSKDLTGFIHQRLRWAGKWRHNNSWGAKFLAVYVLLVQLSLLAGYGFLILGIHAATILSLCVLKLFLEFIFLYSVSSFLKVRWSGVAFFTLQLVYPFYVVGTGLLSQLVQPVWKGRKI